MQSLTVFIQIEYQLITLDDRNQVARVSLMGTDVLARLQIPQKEDPDRHATRWAPEYAEYVIEGKNQVSCGHTTSLLATCSVRELW